MTSGKRIGRRITLPLASITAALVALVLASPAANAFTVQTSWVRVDVTDHHDGYATLKISSLAAYANSCGVFLTDLDAPTSGYFGTYGSLQATLPGTGGDGIARVASKKVQVLGKPGKSDYRVRVKCETKHSTFSSIPGNIVTFEWKVIDKPGPVKLAPRPNPPKVIKLAPRPADPPIEQSPLEKLLHDLGS